MIDCGEGTGLALESRKTIRIRLKRRRQDLDGHVAPEPEVARAINLPHCAGAQHADHLESPDARTRPQRHAAAMASIEILRITEPDSATRNAEVAARPESRVPSPESRVPSPRFARRRKSLESVTIALRNDCQTFNCRAASPPAVLCLSCRACLRPEVRAARSSH